MTVVVERRCHDNTCFAHITSRTRKVYRYIPRLLIGASVERAPHSVCYELLCSIYLSYRNLFLPVFCVFLRLANHKWLTITALRRPCREDTNYEQSTSTRSQRLGSGDCLTKTHTSTRRDWDTSYEQSVPRRLKVVRPKPYQPYRPRRPWSAIPTASELSCTSALPLSARYVVCLKSEVKKAACIDLVWVSWQR